MKIPPSSSMPPRAGSSSSSLRWVIWSLMGLLVVATAVSIVVINKEQHSFFPSHSRASRSHMLNPDPETPEEQRELEAISRISEGGSIVDINADIEGTRVDLLK